MDLRRRQCVYFLSALGGMFALGGFSVFRKRSNTPVVESSDMKGRTLILKFKHPAGQPIAFEWVDAKKAKNLFNSYVAQGRLLKFWESHTQDSSEFIMTFKSKQDLKSYFAYLCRHSDRNHRKLLGVARAVKII